MREIKFRAWDEQNKIMHHDFQFIKSGEGGSHWIVFASDKHPLDRDPHPFKDPFFERQFKITQSTVLKDKDGKEIYEGDIVRFPSSVYGERLLTITFGKNMAEFRGKSSRFCESLFELDQDEYEVVGNIYENPEKVTP